jgi:hypothetical protein
MPKKKITKSTENVVELERKQYIFGADDSRATITLWCDGRDYNPETEGYHPVYSYQITTDKWSFTANDIRGASNETPNLTAASQSLFAFLYVACVDDASDSDKELFPDNVRIWGQQFTTELKSLALEAAKVIGSEVNPESVQVDDEPFSFDD